MCVEESIHVVFYEYNTMNNRNMQEDYNISQASIDNAKEQEERPRLLQENNETSIHDPNNQEENIEKASEEELTGHKDAKNPCLVLKE